MTDAVIDELVLEGAPELAGGEGAAAVGAQGLRLAVASDGVAQCLEDDLGARAVAQPVRDDVAREVIEDDEQLEALGADAQLGEIGLPQGVAARRLEADRLGPLRARASVHELVAVLAQHARDGLVGEPPSLETLELGAKLRRAYLRKLPAKGRVVMETCAEAFHVADAALQANHETRVVPATLRRARERERSVT